MHIDKLPNIVNKHNNKDHSTIKINPFDVKSSTYIEFDKKVSKKILNLKLVTV